MRTRLFLAAATMFAPTPGPAAVDRAPPVQAYQVPYSLTAAKHVLVRVKVNGKGPFNLILDTGAPVLILAKKVAEPLGLDVTNNWATLDRLSIEGGVELEKAQARIDDLFQLEGMNGLGMAGVEIHGLAGYPILARYRITYDFTQPKLTWVPTDYVPDELPKFGRGGAPGGLDALGQVMKSVGKFFGMNRLAPPGPRGFLGLTVRPVGDAVEVVAVVAGGPAAKAGLQPGDRLVRVAGKSITSLNGLSDALSRVGPRERLAVEVHRGEVRELSIETGTGF